MLRRMLVMAVATLGILASVGCSVQSSQPPGNFAPITGGSGDLFIRGTFDLPESGRQGLFVHLRAYNRPLEIEDFAGGQTSQFFRSMHLGEVPNRGPQALRFVMQQDANANKCFSQQTWTLLGWLSRDHKAENPKSGDQYSLFHLSLEPCDACPSGQFCRFGTKVRPHLNLAQVVP